MVCHASHFLLLLLALQSGTVHEHSTLLCPQLLKSVSVECCTVEPRIEHGNC